MARLVPAAALLLIVLLLLPGLDARAGEDWMFDPTFRAPRADDVIHEGPPPLLRSQLDAFVDLFEAAFDVALPADREQALRDAWETTYATSDAAARREFADLVAPLAGLRQRARSGDREVVEEGLRAFRRVLDGRLTGAPDLPPHRLVRDILRWRRETVGSDTPPFPRPAADAYLALVEFVVSVGRNDDFEPTPGQADVVRRDLVSVLRAKPEALRSRIRDVHATWLRLKARWDAADVAERHRLRWKIVGLLADALPEALRVTPGEGGDLVAYARAAAVLAKAQSGYEAWSNLVRHPDAVLSVLDEWLGPLGPQADEVLLYR